MKPMPQDEFDEAMRNKKTIDKMAELLKCKPEHILIRIVELKCNFNEMKTTLRALKPPTIK